MKSFNEFLAESGTLALSTVAGHSTGWVAKAVDTLKERGYEVAPSTTAKGTLHAHKGMARCMIEVDPISGLVTKVQVGDNAPVMQPFNKDSEALGSKREFKSESHKTAYMKALDDAMATIKADGKQGKDAEAHKNIEGSTPGQVRESFEVFGKLKGKLFNKSFETLQEREAWEALQEGLEVHGRSVINEAKEGKLHILSTRKKGTEEWHPQFSGTKSEVTQEWRDTKHDWAGHEHKIHPHDEDVNKKTIAESKNDLAINKVPGEPHADSIKDVFQKSGQVMFVTHGGVKYTMGTTAKGKIPKPGDMIDKNLHTKMLGPES